MHYLFTRSPENIFIKEKQENKNMQLQRNTRELSACHEMYAIQLLSLETAFLFANK